MQPATHGDGYMSGTQRMKLPDQVKPGTPYEQVLDAHQDVKNWFLTAAPGDRFEAMTGAMHWLVLCYGVSPHAAAVEVTDWAIKGGLIPAFGRADAVRGAEDVGRQQAAE